MTISIHALLAESDTRERASIKPIFNFYPRSPCGERRFARPLRATKHEFLSTLSLRRATDWPPVREIIQWISIHALLAESDRALRQLQSALRHFYPRSPCGERRIIDIINNIIDNFYPRSPCGERPKSDTATGFPLSFLSTLSLRRATSARPGIRQHDVISIHALLAESDSRRSRRQHHQNISIHALLAESDSSGAKADSVSQYFYPRSPCGERRSNQTIISKANNFYPRSPCGERPVCAVARSPASRFLSTLSLRRATRKSYRRIRPERFLSTLSLRRATCLRCCAISCITISIHALLAESDLQDGRNSQNVKHFYPRSPCGERL